MISRAFEVGIRGSEEHSSVVYAESSGKAKSKRLRVFRDSLWPDMLFTDLTCRSIGIREIPPTPRELAQREADAFNEAHPIGTVLRYWSGLKEGEPTGTAPIYHEATVVCDHAVIWMSGVSSCHSLSHVERAS